MTIAIGVYLLRSVAAGVWVVAHASQVLSARRLGARGADAWVWPARATWRGGERAGPLVWALLGAVYVAASALALARG